MDKQIGHYEIVGELGRGGMGVVYKAHEQSLGRFVAIKMLGDQVINDPNIRARFLREARSAAALNHPNIIQIYFVGEDAGRPYFAMEYVEGRSLAQLIRHEQQLNPTRAAEILLEAASGLALAHDRGIVHRDIKPANIMITQQGLVKLTDFGIAHVNEGGEKLTATGHLLGTPGYLSPEVCLGKPIEARSDIFSLGIVYFEMLVGRTPFNADSPLAMLREVVEVEIPDPRTLNQNVDLDTHTMLAKMVAKDPSLRYPNCHELADDLRRYLVGRGQIFSSGSNTRSTDPVPNVGSSPSGSLTAPYSPELDTLSDQDATVIVPSPTPPSLPLGVNQQTARMDQPPSALPPTPMTDGVEPMIPPPPIYRADQSYQPQPQFANQQTKKKSSMLIPALLMFAAVAALAVAGGWWFLRDKAEPTPETRITEESTVPDPDSNADAYRNEVGSEKIEDLEPGDQTGSLTENTDSTIDQAAADLGDNLVAPTEGNQMAQTPDPGQNSSIPSPAEVAASASNNSNRTVNPPVQPNAYDSVKDPESPEAPPKTASVGSLAKNAVAAPASPKTSKKTDSINEPTLKSRKDASLPATPILGLVIRGDRSLAGPIFQHLAQGLSENGYTVIDSDVLGIGNDEAKPLDAMGTQVAQKGGDVLLFAEIQDLGQRELDYMGRSSTAYKAEVVIKGWFPAGGRKLGPDNRIVIEYTSLNAERKGEEVASQALETILGYIRTP